jgi:ACR3 family arsenite efflux pump ArsB
MITLTPTLNIAGFEVEYNKIEMNTAEVAKQYKFLSSPTIRVNSQDICQSVEENSCGCCSDISGTDVNCRVGIGFFQKYLTIWVALCMIGGVLIGKYCQQYLNFLVDLNMHMISIPTAILIWVMIYPMMMKVDFQSVKNVGKNPKGLYVTWITNWLIKPFTMYAIASFFLFMLFLRNFITPDLAREYLAGAVLLGAAPCTAMVFVWSTLTKGNPAYTVVQVATNI